MSSTQEMNEELPALDPKVVARDALFDALRIAIPGATHEQLLVIIRAFDAYISIYIQEHESL